MISFWPQDKQLLTSMVLRLFKFPLKLRVCSFLVTSFIWLKIWVQLALDVWLHPFLLDSIFYSLASLLSSGCTISGEGETMSLGWGRLFIFSRSWNGPYSFRPTATLGTCVLNVSHLPAELKFLMALCTASCLIIFPRNLFCLMLMQPPFLWVSVLLEWLFCSFLFILTTQLCLKRGFCRQHMAISCFPNLFQQSLS